VDDNGAAEQGGAWRGQVVLAVRIKQLYACQRGGTCDTTVV
jgi:hypothetical protein